MKSEKPVFPYRDKLAFVLFLLIHIIPFQIQEAEPFQVLPFRPPFMVLKTLEGIGSGIYILYNYSN